LLRRSLPVILSLLLLAACQGTTAAPAPAVSPENSPHLAGLALTPAPQIPASLTAPPTLTPTASPLPPASTDLPTQAPSATTPPITTLLFTGIIVPARCVQAALDLKGDPNYPYEEVRQVLSQADISIGTFNATMSDKTERTGCWRTYQLVGSPANADALVWAGFDVMSVATNHIKDCGAMKSWCDSTMFDTLANMRRVGIQPVGAGENLAEALKPVVITANGVRFGFVSLGDSKLDWSVFASAEHPGIAMLTEENMRQAIAAARQVSDVVIALPHWGSEDILLPNWWQREQALYTVEAGADLVVGNHTHVIQAFHTLKDPSRPRDVPVFYGLGNFIFDQGLRDHRQSIILLVRFQGTRFLDYKLIPIHTDPDGRAHLAKPEEAAEILQRLALANDLLE
jgi:poly-gamma-glutamate capsule biosynthesis protein CapA/YwtB (metallophosphatase superfamily)